MPKTAKQKAWDWCSKYIRLRDSFDPTAQHLYGQCCTCKKYISSFGRDCGDAGHFIPRGIGGSSGVYFDERNIHLQCKRCNKWGHGMPTEYRQFMLNKYGQEVIDKLEFLHKNQSYKGKITAIGEMYRQMYEELKR